MIENAKQILAKPFSTNMTKTLVQAISVELTTGVIVSAFRWIIDQTMQLLYQIYPQMAAQQVLPMIIVTFVAYYILDILGGKPIYEDLRLQMNYHKNIDK